jgi:hypothetical protein
MQGPNRAKEEKRPWIRTKTMKVRMRPGEESDLEVIGAAMGLPAATFAWWIIADYLTRLRNRRLTDLPSTKSVKTILEALDIDTSDVEEI